MSSHGVLTRPRAARALATTLALAVALIAVPGSAQATSYAPQSGETALLRNGSAFNATVPGAGKVAVNVRASSCFGNPKLSVYVDGSQVGSATEVAASATAKVITVGSGIASGQHTVTVKLSSDRYIPGVCDRNLYVKSVWFTQAQQTKATTGVPTATVLKKVVNGSTVTASNGKTFTMKNGILAITGSNLSVSGYDIYGRVGLSGTNLTLANSYVHGDDINKLPQVMTRYSLVQVSGANNFVVDSTLKAQYPNPNWLGLAGYGFTANRVDVSGTVDTILTYGNNVNILNSYTHGNLQYKNDWSWDFKGTPSHSDGWQIEGGENLRISNSSIVNPQMTAIVMTQNHSKIDNVMINNNYLSGGTCTVNIHPNRLGKITGVVLKDNSFGPLSTTTYFQVWKGCTVTASAGNFPTLIGNTATGGRVVSVRLG